MADFEMPDPFGVIAFSVLVAVPVSLLLSRIFVVRYRRAVGKEMLKRGAVVEPPPLPEESSGNPSPPLKMEVIRPGESRPDSAPDAPWQSFFRAAFAEPGKVALVYLAGALAHAAVATVTFFEANDIEYFPFRTLTVFLVFAWPVVPTVSYTGILSPRAFFVAAGVYLLALFLVAWESWSEVLYLLLILTGAPLVLLLPLLGRSTRITGPFALLASFLGVLGAIAGVTMVEWIGWMFTGRGFEGDTIVLLAAGGVGGLVLATLAWPILVCAAQLYRGNRVGKEELMMDLYWLLYTLWICFFTAVGSGWHGLWAILAFPAFTVTTAVGFALLRRLRQGVNRPLLLLRVFGFTRRSETLMARLSRHWSHLGSIRYIGSQDLAMMNLTFERFLLFLNRRLDHVFLKSGDDLAVRLAELDTYPGRSGQFGVQELFCQADSWQRTVRRIAADSAAVLMDLRGFNESNQGCQWEIYQLINLVDARDFLLLTDGTTDLPFLTYRINRLWARMSEESPNRGSPGTIRILSFERHGDRENRLLLQMLCEAVA